MCDWSCKKLPLTGKALGYPKSFALFSCNPESRSPNPEVRSPNLACPPKPCLPAIALATAGRRREVLIPNYVYPCIALAASLLFIQTSHAFSINPKPASFEDIEMALGIGDYEDDGTIPTYLENAQCGGFDYDVSVVGKIPQVNGLPGRDGDYFGNVTSGMAVRNDEGFVAPGDVDVCGYRTACRPDHDAYGCDNPENARYCPPFFDIQPCQRPLGDATPEKDPVPLGRNETDFDFTCGGTKMPTNGKVCETDYDSKGYMYGGDNAGLDGGLCGWLNNRWLYGYYEKKVPVDYSCNDNRDPNGDGTKLLGETLCEVTLYSDNSSCRFISEEDAALGFGQRVLRRDEIDEAQPDDPWLINEKYRLDWVTERQCCTFQNTDEIIYGPDYGAGDTSGDAPETEELLRNCIPCEGSDCRYVQGVSPEPRWQYYPPWVEEVDDRSECFYCFDSEQLELGIEVYISCTDEKAGEPIYPCAGLINERGFHRRERGAKKYRSFFRHYTGSYSRDPVPFTDNNGDKYLMDDYQKSNIPVSCYSMYQEMDYKTDVARNASKSCVIAAYYLAQNRNFWEMGRSALTERGPSPIKIRGTQEGHGEYNSEFQDIPAMIRDTEFDETSDLWYPSIGNAFALTNGKVMEERYNDDLTMVLLQPSDSAHLESTIQLYYTEDDEPDEKDQKVAFSSGTMLRAFDDTVYTEGGDNRAIVEWWQRQETMANLLFSPPSIHLLLPPAWSVGLDPLDPLFTPKIVEHTDLDKDPRSQALDVQLEANEDIIDIVKTFLSKTLTPQIEEELIPVLVPLGSPTEFRALAEKWHGWAIAQNKRGGSGGDDAIELAAKLEQYARYIEEVRKLRGELTWFNNQLFETQNTITETIGEWLNEDVTAQYDEFRSLSRKLEPLETIWKHAQSTYRKMHDINSMPWCHNERFTVPIYSLLDPWMPRRPGLTNDYLPPLNISRKISASFDFTALKAPSGVLEVPVLDPIQVRIAMEVIKPPNIKTEKVNVPTLPDLPPIPSIKEYIENYEDSGNNIYPEINVGAYPPSIEFEIWSDSEIDSFQSILSEINSVVAGMRREYAAFWGSQTMFSYDSPPDALTEQDCYGPHSDTCVHSEMDLLERLMRFGSRPAVLLMEDFLSIGSSRPNPADVGYGIESCPENDWACQLLHGTKTYSYEGWDIDWEEGEMPDLERRLCPQSEGTLSEQLRSCMFQETLVDTSGGENKYPYAVDRGRIIPSFHIPDNIEINHTPIE
ncbi:hypothetical protein KKF55_00620 [Patescibacteria group bacterium]|nr:hypothetical protein [Patescibacteria group bacterium]